MTSRGSIFHQWLICGGYRVGGGCGWIMVCWVYEIDDVGWIFAASVEGCDTAGEGDVVVGGVAVEGVWSVGITLLREVGGGCLGSGLDFLLVCQFGRAMVTLVEDDM